MAGIYVRKNGEIVQKHMIVNSYGSFDGNYAKKSYEFFYDGSANSMASVHRYLDEGASYKICHGPMDIAAADAVDEIKRIFPNRPAILAETGAVQPKHSGPWRFYNSDSDGIIFHDALYTPFLGARQAEDSLGIGMSTCTSINFGGI